MIWLVALLVVVFVVVVGVATQLLRDDYKPPHIESRRSRS
jgi:hypothetical protein